MDKVPDQAWQLMQSHLGYDDRQMADFRSNPRNAQVLAKRAELRSKTIVFEVLQSHGCNSQHKVGTRFAFTGDGNLITKLAPSRVCVFAVPAMAQVIYAFHELLYAGIDPNEACFRRGSCYDIGAACGGWGRIVLEGRVMDRADAEELMSS